MLALMKEMLALIKETRIKVFEDTCRESIAIIKVDKEVAASQPKKELHRATRSAKLLTACPENVSEGLGIRKSKENNGDSILSVPY